MPARLILNADDFGLTRGINRAIAELHTAGCLTSVTLMANGPAFDDAVRIARAHPTLGIGCHIVLVDGTPLCPPATIPTLCPNGSTFRPTLTAFARDVLCGLIHPQDIQTEADAQIRRIQDAGILPTHLDTHKHTHIFSKVLRALRDAAQRRHVRAIRNPFEPSYLRSHAKLSRRLQMTVLHMLQPRYQVAAGGMLTTDGTFGIAATGSLTSQTLQEILARLPDVGTYELLCHPGYHDTELTAIPTRLRAHREIELPALLQEVPKILSIQKPPTLITYADLAP